MKLRTRLAAVLVVVAGAAMSVPAVAAAPQSGRSDTSNPEVYVFRTGGTCAPLTKTINGTVQGMDHRFANVMISMNLQTSSGGAIGGGGCAGGAGYGIRVHVNYSVPASGAVPGTPQAQNAVTQWSVAVPANAERVYIEVYPQKQASRPIYGGTDKSHYGFTERPGLHLPGAVTGPVNLALPIADCASPHAAGTLAGRFLSGGRAVSGVRVSAFSAGRPPADPISQGPLGFGLWNGNATSYRIPLLASGAGKGQPYTVIARLASGRSKTFTMTSRGRPTNGVHPCRVTTFNLSF